MKARLALLQTLLPKISSNILVTIDNHWSPSFLIPNPIATSRNKASLSLPDDLIASLMTYESADGKKWLRSLELEFLNLEPILTLLPSHCLVIWLLHRNWWSLKPTLLDYKLCCQQFHQILVTINNHWSLSFLIPNPIVTNHNTPSFQLPDDLIAPLMTSESADGKWWSVKSRSLEPEFPNSKPHCHQS